MKILSSFFVRLRTRLHFVVVLSFLLLLFFFSGCNFLKENTQPLCNQVVVIADMLKSICAAINDPATSPEQRVALQNELNSLTKELQVVQHSILKPSLNKKR